MTLRRRSRSTPSGSASVSSLTPPVSRSSREATCASCSTSPVPVERANPCPTGAILNQAAGTASNLRLTISPAMSRRCATRRRTSATRSSAAEAASRSCLRTPPATPSNFSNPQGPDAAAHRCWTGVMGQTELRHNGVLRSWFLDLVGPHKPHDEQEGCCHPQPHHSGHHAYRNAPRGVREGPTILWPLAVPKRLEVYTSLRERLGLAA